MSPRQLRIRSANDQFQQLEALRRSREKRRQRGAFLVEGVRPINLALRYGWPLRALITGDERQLSGWAEALLRDAPADEHVVVAQPLMARLSGKQEPSELLALVGIPPDDPGRIPTPPDALVALFDRPVSPGNLGTLIRACDALGAHGLFVSGHACDLYDPETVSASTGSLFALPAVRLPSQRELLPWLDAARARLPALQVVGTDEEGDVDLEQGDLTRPTLLLLGNETWGLSAAYRGLCERTLRIPIGGAASSLNVAVAGAIVLYEAGRQRRAADGGGR